MILAAAKAVVRRVRSIRQRRQDRFLRGLSGVVHVGANTGQERALYDYFGLRVLWIEPIPEIFRQLQQNIAPFPKQRAVQALLTDREGADYEFHVANNSGASSSILDLKDHHDLWPDVEFSGTIRLKSTTLAALFTAGGLEADEYEALVMDVQGAELLVLQGAIPLLNRFRYIKTEVPDFESYAGCCQLAEMDAFMREHGFREHSRREFASRAGVGSYFDVVYEREGGRA